MVDIAARCHGVVVPRSPFLNDKRIERINAARYERHELAGALHVVRDGDRVLELGAGIGLVGAVAALNRNPARVMSFEANPALIPHIRALYAANGLDHVIAVHNELLMSDPDAPGALPFYIHNSYLGSSLGGDPGRAKEVVQVPTRRYGDLRESFVPDVILMDIEGGEAGFLDHADLSGLRAIVIEFHPETYGVEGMRACKDKLRDAGFAPIQDLSTRKVWVAQRGDPDAG